MKESNYKYTVSVRLMTYMHEKFIAKAMEGIMMQKVDFNVEVVVGDDFSNDKTLDIIQSYNNTENIHIHILNREKGDAYWKKRQRLGRLYNFINILENCSGKFIAILDGDDYWTDPLKLQKQVDFLEATPEYVGTFHNTDMINEMEKNPKLKTWRTFDKQKFTLTDTISKFALFHTSSFVFKRTALSFPDWFTEIQSGDMALFSIIASKGPFYRIDETMSVYRKNETGVTNNVSEITYHKNRIKLYKNISNYLKEREKEKIQSVLEFHKKQCKKLRKRKIKNKARSIFSRKSSLL